MPQSIALCHPSSRMSFRPGGKPLPKGSRKNNFTFGCLAPWRRHLVQCRYFLHNLRILRKLWGGPPGPRGPPLDPLFSNEISFINTAASRRGRSLPTRGSAPQSMQTVQCWEKYAALDSQSAPRRRCEFIPAWFLRVCPEIIRLVRWDAPGVARNLCRSKCRTLTVCGCEPAAG